MIAKKRDYMKKQSECIYLVNLEEFAVKLSWSSMPNMISHVIFQE